MSAPVHVSEPLSGLFAALDRLRRRVPRFSPPCEGIAEGMLRESQEIPAMPPARVADRAPSDCGWAWSPNPHGLGTLDWCPRCVPAHGSAEWRRRQCWPLSASDIEIGFGARCAGCGKEVR